MSAPMPDPNMFHLVSLAPLPPSTVALLEASPFGPFVLHVGESPDRLRAQFSGGECHALILAGSADADVKSMAIDMAVDAALIVVIDALDAEVVQQWLQCGAQDVLLRAELRAPTFALRLRSAIERKKLECDARTAYATDLETGLPHQQQFIEHVSQLLALREREPAPMAVLVLRVEGLATTEARFGRQAANVLRRKVGVRLRAGVRASDVVASIGDDSFAVLLGSILTPADADRVGAKLLAALMAPVKIAGQDVTVATALGIGQYPQDGAQPDALLRRAINLAAAAPAQGRAGYSNFGEAGGAAGHSAANDE